MLSAALPTKRSVVLIGGIYVFFLLFGFFQESIFKVGDGTNKFRFPMFLVLSLCIGNLIISGFILLFEHLFGREFAEITPPIIDDTGVKHVKRSAYSRRHHHETFLQKYITGLQPFVLKEIALSSVTYTLSMLSTNYALSHVNYPTQILVKSAKTVPVILGGFIFFRKKYPKHDYVAVAVITVSLTIFNLAKKSKTSPHQTTLGLALLGLSLLCDSMTGPRQDNLLAAVNISSTHLMFLTNVFASIIAGGAFVLFEGIDALQFCSHFPETAINICCFALSAALGQLFIFGSLTEFGSLHLAIITTTRKFFTVLLSIIFFRHPISGLQWLCVTAVFIAIGVQSVLTKQLKMKAAAHKKN